MVQARSSQASVTQMSRPLWTNDLFVTLTLMAHLYGLAARCKPKVMIWR